MANHVREEHDDPNDYCHNYIAHSMLLFVDHTTNTDRTDAILLSCGSGRGLGPWYYQSGSCVNHVSVLP